ncbi:GlcNAc-transferase family protein [Pantoea septica]|uniref:GlcNAc-transferase family protein n=1 Tax=Pantoea septica TaxID=472695 RepID=UPI0028992AE5|nr:GlcNAc-transferase family protein [Pantoea septica]
MDTSATIFVSIASYRDPELLPTLKDMLRQAANPENMHIAVCWQDDQPLDIFNRAGFIPEGQRTVEGLNVAAFRYRQARIDIITVHYFSSQGACWARSRAESLYEGEHYFLQIDSHCRFIANWDREMILMFKQLSKLSPLPIISSYPPAYTPGEDEESSKKTYVSRPTFREYNEQGIPMFGSVSFDASQPVRGSYLAAGFIFTLGEFVRTVPNDPQIFFAGEEIAMAVRAFTYGYDVYHPHKPLLWHFYQRDEHNKVWGDHNDQAKSQGEIEKAWWERDRISKKRVRTLLGLENDPLIDLGPYTTGNQRTLKQFEFQTGLWLRNGTALPEVIENEKTSYFAVPPDDENAWRERHRAFYRKTLTLNASEYVGDEAEMDALYINVYSKQNELLYKRMLDLVELSALRAASGSNKLALELQFKTASQVKPSVIRLGKWSNNSGWGTVTEEAW